MLKYNLSILLAAITVLGGCATTNIDQQNKAIYSTTSCPELREARDFYNAQLRKASTVLNTLSPGSGDLRSGFGSGSSPFMTFATISEADYHAAVHAVNVIKSHLRVIDVELKRCES